MAKRKAPLTGSADAGTLTATVPTAGPNLYRDQWAARDTYVGGSGGLGGSGGSSGDSGGSYGEGACPSAVAPAEAPWLYGPFTACFRLAVAAIRTGLDPGRPAARAGARPEPGRRAQQECNRTRQERAGAPFRPPEPPSRRPPVVRIGTICRPMRVWPLPTR